MYDLVFDKKVTELLENYDDNLYAPKRDEVFRALDLTPLDQVSVCILGQDPYPVKGDACGLSFSVNREDKLPKSLKNMFKELESDLGIVRTNGDLSDMAKQGVLLLNTILTVEIGNANSHKNLGWQTTTDHIIKQVSDQGDVVFVLLGKQAHEYEKLVDDSKNIIIKEFHPSPLSAYRGFFGSKLYSKINEALRSLEKKELTW